MRVRLTRSLFCSCIVVFCALAASYSSQADDSTWTTAQVPEVWKTPPDAIQTEGQGFAWFRCRFVVPQDWSGRSYTMLAESADEARQYYLNGQLVVTTGEFPPTYRSGLGSDEQFMIPADAIRPGAENVLSIRLFQREARTSFNVAAPVILADDQAIQLKGAWEYHAGDLSPELAAASADGDAYREVITRERALSIWKLLDGDAGPLAIDEALSRFKVPDDLTIELAVGEPEVRQPLTLRFDAHGRMWVLQYLQYPNPAGLTMVSRDKFLRTVWDKVPPPPPNQNEFRGADTISIHEDTDGDGRFDQHKTFLDDLNMATSFAFDRDGVWVLNPPYLLFYSDRDHDDQPDGAPEVHLEGFGLEDSHSLTNSLRWGPDGWLYAAQGSTVTGHIKHFGASEQPVHSMGQLIWRYHPKTRKYEIFAEGGGNAFGVEVDSAGRVYSGHNGGDTRGFHYVQGGYFQKGFGKHGELSNPYAFGYFPQMSHHAVPRFTHTFVIYEADTLPRAYHGRLFGVAPLLSHVVISAFEPDRSSFKTRDEGHAATTDDPWFRPVDIQLGPDGALYVCDFYEQRIDHASHYQGRIHRESGRIYRIRAKDAPAYRPVDLGSLTTEQLVGKLEDKNRLIRQIALALIRERKASTALPLIRRLLSSSDQQTSLEALWALNAVASLDDDLTIQMLRHENPQVRLWTARLACDDGEVSSRLAEELRELSRTERDVHVRSQLACSAKRLPAAAALPIVSQLARHDEDAADIHIPLLLWWAVEAKAQSDSEQILAMLGNESLWQSTIVREYLLERLMRRFASTGSRRDLLVCAELLKMAPDDEAGKRLMAGFEKAFEGRLLTGLPPQLVEQLAARGGGSFVLRMRQGDAEALTKALEQIANDQTRREDRTLYIQVLSQIKYEPGIPALIKIAESSADLEMRSTALSALQAFSDDSIAETVIKLHDSLPEQVREVAQSLLASRPGWAKMLLDSITAGQVNRELFSQDMVRRLLLHNDPQIVASVEQLWGDVQGATTEEMRAAIEQFQEIIQQGSGNPYSGEVLFAQSCGKCHMLFNQGGQIGPDLTAYRRDDLRGMLANIVNPSLEIREGFENYVVVTADGRTLNGFLIDQDPQTVTLRGADGQSSTIARDEIEEMQAIPRSIMPEGILVSFDQQQIRDLFAYLRATQPLP